jgi:hypothetical protein
MCLSILLPLNQFSSSEPCKLLDTAKYTALSSAFTFEFYKDARVRYVYTFVFKCGKCKGILGKFKGI